jgi:pimeloyl-ACP methyl ester carboxylesterase
MPFFSRDNIEFHYLDRGDGVPVFFQHGLGGDAGKIFALLALPPGFRLLSLDCRAHGKTGPLGPADELRFDSMADDLIALMDSLQIAHAVLGGTSMGAGVALNCALRHRRRVVGLVLLRPAWLDVPNEANVELFSFIARLIRYHGPHSALEVFKKSEPCLRIAKECPDAAESLLALFLDPHALETIDRLERIPRDVPNRGRSQWRRIAVPTLVLATRGDPIHPYEYGQALAQAIRGARFEQLTSKSTNLAQYTADLNRCLGDFLQSHFRSESRL